MDGNPWVLSYEYPRLGGQHEDYLVMALKAYRSRAIRQNAIMSSFAQNLSDRDIADLAAWFAPPGWARRTQDRTKCQ